MEQQVFLDEKKSRVAQSKEHALDVSLVNKTGLLPKGAVESSLSLYQLYMNERDSSNKYRLILTVNPICTNVLFNMKTEVVQNEGTPKCISLSDDKNEVRPIKANNTTALNRKQAIRDTEYSHPDAGKYVYHCGLDIFNNHMLRQDNFVHINPYNSASKSLSAPVYNTIADYNRSGNGDIIQENVNAKHTEKNKTNMHLYQYDTILSFSDCFTERMQEKDGWYGFTNPGTIDIANNTNGVNINRMMANNKPCEFIDMYPDRSLYSFAPKYNKALNREERNWDYCLTYPYSSDTTSFKRIMGNENMKSAAMRFFFKDGSDVNGNRVLKCRSLIPHTLKTNDRIRIYYGADAAKCIKSTLRVVSVGNDNGGDKDRCFMLSMDGLSPYIEDMQDGAFFKKVVNGSECEYYERKMKQIYRQDGGKLNSSVGRQAFSENIYGDGIAQIIYTDDINIGGLRDNLGAPLSDIYFTVVKRNKGYEKWYEDNDFVSSDIEFSHCFGKVTAGYDMGDITEFDGLSGGSMDFRNYNVRYLHNIDVDRLDSGTKDCWGNVFASASPMSNGEIVIDLGIYPGDLVEFSPSEYTETVLSECQFRFNTAQRETLNVRYRDMFQDELYYDDYDMIPNTDTHAKFTVLETPINGSMTARTITSGRVFTPSGEYDVIGNICPEGYFYKPYYNIKLRERNDSLNVADATLINYGKEGFLLEYDNVGSGRILTIVSPSSYQFKKDDTVALYNVDTQEILWGTIYENTYSSTVKIYLDNKTFSKVTYESLEPGNANRVWYVFVSTASVPMFARYVPSVGSFVWRDNVLFSQLNSNSDLYNTPFANGCHYLEPRFNIFLKRQDPNGELGMLVPIGAKVRHPMRKYAIYGNGKLDLSEVRYVGEELGKVCY